MINDLMISYPKESVVLVSILVTLIMTLIAKYFTNQDRMRELKTVQKTCQIKLKENKNDAKKMAEIQKQMLECNMEMMKHSMKPLLFAFIPLILLIGWLKGVYVETEIAKSWLWWYIGSGVLSSLIFRRLLNVV
ncbi:MAG: EMC3/TMCO1 family protein [Nanoarchaeota archaeon]